MGFNAELLRNARWARGFTQAELSTELQIRQSAVSRWEDGIRTPSPEDVVRLASILHRTPDFFYQTDRLFGVDIAFLFHRKRARLGVKELQRIHAQVNIVRLGISRLLRNVEDWPIQFECMDVDDEKYSGPTQIAVFVRTMWQVSRGPIPNLIGLVENAGGIVIPIDFGTDLVDAIGQWPTGMPPLFFINRDSPTDRMRFSLAHEVAHIIMHRVPSQDIEREADEFAAEFLFPSSVAREELVGLTLDSAMRLKLKWRVSAKAIIMHAGNVGAITERKRRSLFVQLAKAGFSKREPQQINAEQPTTLRRLVSLYKDTLGYEFDKIAELAFYNDPDEFSEQFLCDGKRNTQSLRVVW